MAAAPVDQSWRPTFDFFDMDRSGSISAKEMQTCLKALGQKVTEEEVVAMIGKADGDGSGELDYEEFLKIMTNGKSQKMTRSLLKKYFQTLDNDGSGYITTAELRHDLTSLNQGLSDEDMDKIMDMYDVDGDGQITLPEFELIVSDMGLQIEDDEEQKPEPAEPEADGEPKLAELVGDSKDPKEFELLVKDTACEVEEGKGATKEEDPAEATAKAARTSDPLDEPVDVSDPKLAEILKPLADSEGKVRLSEVSRAVDMWKKYHSVKDQDPESDPALHWTKGRVKHGLGEVIYKANHIALIVSDVGRSAAFYSDVIGLQQIRRPDFDRHGAWFTMGNLELHLIKGVPVVHSGADLIVGHISIETFDIDKVPGILQRAGVPFRQNVSVPKGKMAQGSGTNATNNNSNIVKQYFLRDPDGYYLEICNCDVLTQYCLGDINELAGYDQGAALDLQEAGVFVNIGLKIASTVASMRKELVELGAEMGGKSIEEVAQRLGAKEPAKEIDEERLKKLLVRRSVYGDICQNESEEDLKRILLLAGNYVPLAMKIMHVRAEAAGEKVFAPPAFFEEGKTKVTPKLIRVPTKKIQD